MTAQHHSINIYLPTTLGAANEENAAAKKRIKAPTLMEFTFYTSGVSLIKIEHSKRAKSARDEAWECYIRIDSSGKAHLIE